MNFIAVGIGGFIGAVLRYQLGKWIGMKDHFPLGTFMINAIGCFVLGWFLAYGMKNNIDDSIRLAIATGLLGAFTTFSTFSIETIELIGKGEYTMALTYVGGSIFLGLLFGWMGMMIG